MSAYPTAGPSRQQTLPLPPPPVPTKSPAFPSSSSFADDASGSGPWADAHDDAGPQYTDGIDPRAEGSKRNPLVDLIDTEKIYVEQLGLVIRRVAAAWSKKDFPPHKLDAMFRCVEAVYRANRSLGNKLREIGPSPSSPKAIGDLLMRWIDDLEPSYRRYSQTYLTGFDSYTPVTRNLLLPGILTEISTTSPPSPPLTHWSLDALFLLPYTRLRYYRKLYARLLRSTKEGRSDHRLLLVANQRLETLVADVENRLEMDVLDEGSPTGTSRPAPPPVSHADPRSREPSWQEKERASRASSGLGSSQDSQQNISPFSSRMGDPRDSGGSTATSVTQSPSRRPTINFPLQPSSARSSVPSTPVMPLSDLELRIDTSRTLDLFTMQPKTCQLQMNPPTQPFTRKLRSSHDVSIFFTPTATGNTVTYRRAHIFILSDLFLIAEWMDATDKAAKAIQVAKEQPERVGQGGPMPEMWLCYPPLAGRHLIFAEGEQSNVLNVVVMRKETFVIHAESELARDQITKDLMDCIDFASGSSQRNTAVPSPNDAGPRSPSSLSESRSEPNTFPPLRYPSPFSNTSSPARSPPPGELGDMGPPAALAGNALHSQMDKMSLQPGETITWQGRPSPPPPTLPPGAGPAAHVTGGSSLPPRGASLRPRQVSTPLPNSLSPPTMGPPLLPALPFSVAVGEVLPGSSPTIPQGAQIPRSPSGRSVQSALRPFELYHDAPPVPPMQARGPGSHLSEGAPSYPPVPGMPHAAPSRSRSAEPLRPMIRVNTEAAPRMPNGPPEPPSARFSSFPLPGSSAADMSPPTSPVDKEDPATLTGPAVISAQMKCKVFLKQAHQQWKSLGAGKLKLYTQKSGGKVKQLVVESDSSSKNLLISTIVLTDGVERVAKTGVAVEISDRGARTGIVYMIQLRNENSAAGLFESLLAGSDRTAR